MITVHNDRYDSHHHLGMTKEKTMKKTSIRFVVGVLAITALILMSGTVLANSSVNATNGTNATNATGTANVTTNETNVTSTTALPTETVEEGSTAIQPEESEPSSDGDKKVVSTGAKPEKTTPNESPGFESILAIVVILSTIYILRTNRK